MVIRKTLRDKIFDVFNVLILILLAFACLYPMMHVLSGSLSDPVKLSKYTGPLLWPQGFSLRGYDIVFHNPNIWRSYANTLFYVIFGTAMRTMITMLGAYVLSRKNFMLRRPMMLMIVFTMYFGGGLIPNYLLVSHLDMLDTRWAVIIPSLISTWNMIILKTAFQGIPASLEESARLDGAKDINILTHIILPVAKPTIAVIVLYYAVAEWNSWFSAAIYLPTRRDYYPLQLILREILIINSSGGNESGSSGDMELATVLIENVVRYSTIIVATVPILCIYPFIQKYFVKGIMMGSLKE